MNDREVAAVLAYLAAAYPNTEIGAATAEVYREHLAELTLEQAQAAARAHVARSRFFPTVAELLADCGAAPEFPSVAEAWHQVCEAVGEGTREGMHPLVREVFNVTIDNTWNADLGHTARKFFADAYTDALEHARRADRLAIARRLAVATELAGELPGGENSPEENPLYPTAVTP